MSTLSKQFVSGARRGVNAIQRQTRALIRTTQEGLQTVEWIFLVVGILALAVIVIAAVNAFTNGQIAKLPG